MICRTVLALVLAALPALAVASQPGDALSRIEGAFADGRIDEPTRALLGFQLVRAPEMLPEEFRPAPGEARPRCGTELVRRAHVAFKKGYFDAEQSAIYQAVGGRPNMPNKLAVMNGANTVQIATIHYGNNVTPGDAQEIAGYLTNSWDTQFGAMGWRAPPPDPVGVGAANPGAEYDFYLDPTLGFAYTQPTQENGPESWDDSPSYIVMDNQVPNAETYVAHELNHASQFAYDYADGDFIYEATATWMEDKVYDGVDDYVLSGFVIDFQNQPDETLSYARGNDFYVYGGAVFFHYLSDVYDGSGTTLVRNVWDFAKNGSNDWYDGVEDALNAESFDGIAEIYQEFAGIRLLTKTRGDGTFDEENNFANVRLEASYAFDDLAGGSTDDPPFGMGANYIVVTSLGAEPGDSVTLRVKSDDPGPWSITTVAIPDSGPADISVFRDTEDEGRVEATVENVASYDQIGFAIANVSNANQGVDYSFGGGVDRTPHEFSWSFAGVGGGGDEPVGCGCAIPGGRRSPNRASVLGAFLLATGVILARRAARSA